ncbi:pteridine reductase [Pinirhizobacter soli]|uniref:pteridine reductase n=1 Tax=Pinirhizobacter soli TaxID=2786953 RepID=UPI00202A9979|nr:pteridine reductase [Pinirhizobacter soli]
MSKPACPVVLITGAARRIGAAVVRRLHAEGFDIALHYHRSKVEAQALAAELNALRADSVLALSADLADDARLATMAEEAARWHGRLDALVNNASSFHATPVGSIDGTAWDNLFASNARAPLFLSQAAAPHLAAQQGAIVNMVDIYAERPLREHTVYGMAKAALVAMTQSLAIELAPQVRVNAIAPGAILWPEHGKDYTERDTMIAATPLKRCGDPDDIASTVLWLLRDAKFVTGQVIRVDGGRSLAM